MLNLWVHLFRLKAIDLLKNFELALFVSHPKTCNITEHEYDVWTKVSKIVLKVFNPSRTFSFDWGRSSIGRASEWHSEG